MAVTRKFEKFSVDQYKLEERSIVAKRLISYHDRINELLDCMIMDKISTTVKINDLKSKIYDYTLDLKFKRSKNMGEILKNTFEFVERNYKNVHTEGL